ncbi:DNA primase [Scopulibacillus darangshiensis]|uniref:DNA primase n=1 Tax=Scopulibacillus darangshiensis TaxID=442528 RepID=A0A4V2SNT2_9BACL|nr:DNA primase [Scopulibacillus darangshiensis]TCP32356.1 DNA primase [Scopulibacillus darangshiensis]
MRLPEETIEKIRTSLDIVEIIGEYVQLKKQGRNYFAVCPFHNEHTPSFSVSPEKQIFNCFGCGVGGNIYTFIMEIEGLSFVEAVYFLGEKANVDLPNRESAGRENEPKNREKETLYHALELLAKFYHFLINDARYGQAGKAYLIQRGFDETSIDKFQLGYAVNSWETATRFLKKRGVPLELMEDVGLLSTRQFDNKYFDRYRNRIIFPIWNHRGKTVAFAGRVLTDEKPKYLNTPESVIFHKGKLLYGYHLARASIKQKNQVVLFEGYVDVIKAHQAGVTNAVASMGTSLTEEQAGLLTRNAESIIICYDSDEAGINATFRAAEMLKDSGRIIRVAKIPKGLDPDDYISKFGGERFRNDVIGASQTLMAFKMDFLKNGRKMQDEGDRMRYIEEVLKEIADLRQAVERDHYLRQLSEEFSISLDALKQQQFQIYRQRQKKGKARDLSKPVKYKNQITLYPAYQMAERQLLAHMMRDVDIAERVQDAIGGFFNIDIHQALAAHLYAFYSEGKRADISAFIQRLSDPELQKTASDIAMMQVNERASEKEIDDYIQQVIKQSHTALIEEKEDERKKAEQNHDDDLAARLLAEIISMKKEMMRH